MGILSKDLAQDLGRGSIKKNLGAAKKSKNSLTDILSNQGVFDKIKAEYQYS
jgi:hypothetical protein